MRKPGAADDEECMACGSWLPRVFISNKNNIKLYAN